MALHGYDMACSVHITRMARLHLRATTSMAKSVDSGVITIPMDGLRRRAPMQVALKLVFGVIGHRTGHQNHRQRPNNSFKPTPLRGVGKASMIVALPPPQSGAA